jgi:hypothetical protein
MQEKQTKIDKLKKLGLLGAIKRRDMKVKIFSNSNYKTLEVEINKWFDEKYSYLTTYEISFTESSAGYSVMIIYKT